MLRRTRAMRSLVAMDTVVTIDPAMLLRVVEVYELDRIAAV